MMQEITWEALCGAAKGANMNLSAIGHWSNSGDDQLTYNAWGAAVSEVEIDVLSGDFKVLRTDVFYDCAKSLNPAIDIGQVPRLFVMLLC